MVQKRPMVTCAPTSPKHMPDPLTPLKFMYSEKATKFFEISTVDFSYVVPVKSTVEVSQNLVAFSEYKNFTKDVFPISLNTASTYD